MSAADPQTANLPHPPAYTEASPAAPAPYEQNDESRNFIPDDFKFSTTVLSCEPQVRMWFMRKVYTLLACQILASFLFSLWVSRTPSAQEFIITHMWCMVLALVGGLVSCVWLSLAPRKDDFDDAANSVSLLGEQTASPAPWYCLSYRGQLALLAAFTFFEAYSLSIVTVAYDPQTVLSALFVTSVVVVGVTLLALSGRFDSTLSSAGSIYYWLNLALWLLIGIGFSSLFFGMNSKVDLFYSWGGAIIFTVYLFIDTQLVFRKVYPDEEIRCAMILYLDVINLFLYILRIMARNRDD